MTAQMITRRRSLRTAEGREELARMLVASAAGDSAAFMRFYDATCGVVYQWALGATADPAAAEELSRSRYVQAWLQAARQAESGLSPLAWLLSLSSAPSVEVEPGQAMAAHG